MLISGWVKTSLLDYPDRISSVVFTQGCNLKCFYCHNPELINKGKIESQIDERMIFKYLNLRKNFIDGVVITGGEPTIHNDLDLFLYKIKKLGFVVKLDTNGTRPGILGDLISKQLLDYIAMDVKAPIGKYYEICGEDLDYSCIMESISIIKNSGVEHEFRTTLAERLEISDVKAVKDMIGLSSNMFVQKCKENGSAFSIEELVLNIPQVQVRGF